MLIAFAALLVSIIALGFSNYFASLSARYGKEAADATLTQVRLERSPILTEQCSLGGQTNNLDAGVQIYPNATFGTYPNLFGNAAPEFTQTTGTYIICTIHNYGRLPAVDVRFEYGYSYCMGVYVMKSANLGVRVIAPGSTAKVGVQNGSELSSLVVVPLRQTSFVTPPDSTRQSYMFLGSDALGSFQLNPLVVPHSEGTVGKRAGIPSNAYCNRLLKQSSQSWVSWYHRGIEKLNVGQRYVFKSSRPNLPIGYLAPRGGCPTRLMGLNTQQVQQPGVWINDPKTMEIVALSKDHTVTTLRGPGGGLVCIGSSMFFPPKP